MMTSDGGFFDSWERWALNSRLRLYLESNPDTTTVGFSLVRTELRWDTPQMYPWDESPNMSNNSNKWVSGSCYVLIALATCPQATIPHAGICPWLQPVGIAGTVSERRSCRRMARMSGNLYMQATTLLVHAQPFLSAWASELEVATWAFNWCCVCCVAMAAIL